MEPNHMQTGAHSEVADDRSSRRRLYIVVACALLVFLTIFLVIDRPEQSPSVPIPTPKEGDISVRGIVTCLPPVDIDKEQTMECAFGLRDAVGRYYVLRDSDPQFRRVLSIPTGSLVDVEGYFTPEEGSIYASVGILDVAFVSEARSVQSVDVRGTFICLNSRSGRAPRNGSCVEGIRASNGDRYALSFGILATQSKDFEIGDKVQVQGALTPIERIGLNQWQQYNVLGVISATGTVALSQ